MTAVVTRLRAVPLWQSYLIGAALLLALYVFVPPFAGSGPVFNLLGLSPVLAILIGVRRYKPASRAPWLWFAFGFALFWLGDLYTYSYPRLLGKEVGFPSVGDGFYLFVYPALMAGLVILIRRRNPEKDRAAAIDSLIMSLGLALLSWVLLIQPYVHEETLSLSAKLVSIAYPLGDILLLAAAIRLAVDSGKRLPAFYLMVGSIIALLATDFAYGLVTLDGAYDNQVWLDVGWISFYVLWGAAALHPSMRELEHAAPERRETRLTPARLVLLTIASLMAPIVGLVTPSDDPVGDVAAILLFALVVTRMAGLVRQQERSVDRERILSAAGAELVAATSRDQIYQAALGAARALAGNSPSRLCLIEDGRVVVAAAAGDLDSAEEGWTIRANTATALIGLAKGTGAAASISAEGREDLRLPPTAERAFVLGLSVRTVTRGLLVIATETTSRALRSSLDALATEVSLALESAGLTEEVHRRRGEARFSSLVQHSSDLITVLDAGATVVYQSPSIERVLGYRTDEIVGTRFDRLLHAGEEGRLPLVLAGGTAQGGPDTEVLECKLRHRDGSLRHFEVLYTDLLNDENVRGIVLNSRDVSERKAFESQLEHQAFHDSVTGLPNRALFVERARHAVARMLRDRSGLAVLFLDLDDFKTINDSLGHAAGDSVLLEVAKRLASSVRAGDTAARFGGDEFAILLEDVASAQEAADTAERILESLEGSVRIEGIDVVVRCSLGIAVAEGEAAVDADELIRNADASMYIAKREGKGGYRLFEPAMHEGVLERLELRADLQRAMTSGQLELYYQPVVRLSDCGVTGVEALLRWRHPERGLIAPDVFIPLAEEMGLIVPIGRWVLREACRQGGAIQSLMSSDPPLSMSVNLSVKQLQYSDIAADVREALAESGLPAGTLTLEITETVMMTDTELAVQRLDELKALGIRLAMDDFGTGYSSLSYLSRLPVDQIKMDRSFLSSGASPQQSALASAVVSLGETLHLEVVAEGIELHDQWIGLRELGCDLGQGFLFAGPMDAEATLDFLRESASGNRCPAAPSPTDAP